MILDSSALVAMLTGEPEADALIDAVSRAPVRRISAATFVEASVVLEVRHGPELVRQLDAFLRRAAVVVEPVTEAQAHGARQAYLDYGKGRHPAALNFGNCFAYALAKALDEPLLFKGGDFAQTDVTPAL